LQNKLNMRPTQEFLSLPLYGNTKLGWNFSRMQRKVIYLSTSQHF